jgi:hypothetical protein
MHHDDATTRPKAAPDPELSGRASLLPKREPSRRFKRAWRRLRILARMRRLYWLRAAMRLAPGESQRLFLLTASIGASCGLAAVAFHLLIRLPEKNLIERALEVPGTRLEPRSSRHRRPDARNRTTPGKAGVGLPSSARV